jgi:Putative phage metallopeptidase
MSERRTWKDETGEIEKVAEELLGADEFPLLEDVETRILYAWVSPPEEEASTGRILEGKTRRLGARDRDLYGYDIAIIISIDLWKSKTPLERKKLMWHELNHIMVEEDKKKGCIKQDKAGRVVYKLRKHDLNLERFAGEIVKFGADEFERAFAGTLSQIVGAPQKSRCSCAHPDASECARAGRHLGAGVQQPVKTSPGAGATVPDTSTAPDVDKTTKMAAAGSRNG